MIVDVPTLTVEGWSLALGATPPAPAPHQLVTVFQGAGRWHRGDRYEDLEPSSTWWSEGCRDQRWEGSESTRWFSLSCDHCPWGPAEAGLHPCPEALAGVRELVSIVTDCPFPCELKDLLTRGKTLTLVSTALVALGRNPTADRYGARFYADDLDRVRQAREVLVAEMDAPPTIPDLARRVGLNEVKLKAGFRRLWGTTVYGCLRSERMERARAFLEAGRGTVTEAAAQVGYTNASHFAEAFRRQFGTTPGALVRSQL